LRLHSALNPKALAPLLPSTFVPLLSDWEFLAPPVIQLDLAGTGPDIQQLSGTGQYWLGPTRFRGVSLNSGSGTFRLKQSEILFEGVKISRDEGMATGSFTLNLRSRKLDQCQAQAHLQPTTVAAWFEPSLLPLLDHFHFSQAPDLTFHLSELAGQTELSMHIDATAELVYRCGFLEVPLTSASADLRETADKVAFSIPTARIGDGQGSISAQQVPGDRTIEVEVNFDRVSLANLRIRSALFTGWEGLVSGSLKSRFDTGDSGLAGIEGKLILDAVDFSKPRFVEGGFKKLTAAGFNRLGQLDVEFVAEPGVVRISRLSLASANHVVDLSGTLELGLGGVDLVGHLDQDAALARVTGIVTDPDWEIAVPHRD
jgi:hypothetical protein